MKRCPQCNRVETDHALVYCRVDGAALISDSGAVGAASTEIETSILPHRTDADINRPTAPTTVLPESTSGTTRNLEKPKRRKTIVVVAIIAAVALGLAVVASTLVYLNLKKPASTAITSIAVLPFTNATGDKEIDFLSEGIAETLINSFTKIPELKVIARSTAFRYRGREGEPEVVGRELGVGSVLTGRLGQRGDTLSIQVDLINTSDGVQIWGNRYEGKSADIVNIQQRIASDVSAQLKLKLTGAQQQQIARTYTQNAEAYQHYLRGRYHWNRRTSDGMAQAVAEFQKAVQKDPAYAFGYVGLADAFVLQQEYGRGTSYETLSNSRAYALRALEIDPSLGEAHATLGLVAAYSYQWGEAESHFKKAMELTPRYATTYQWFHGTLRDTGREAEALQMILRAKELDPLSGIIGVNAGLTYAVTGDFKSAEEQLNRVIELDRGWWGGYFWLGLVHLQAGKTADALRNLEKGVEMNRSSRTLGTYGFTLAVSGRKAEALAVARELEQHYAGGGNYAVNIAAVYAGLSENEKAFEWLERAYADRNSELPRLRWYPHFETLRADTRCKELLKRMGLPE